MKDYTGLNLSKHIRYKPILPLEVKKSGYKAIGDLRRENYTRTGIWLLSGSNAIMQITDLDFNIMEAKKITHRFKIYCPETVLHGITFERDLNPNLVVIGEKVGLSLHRISEVTDLGMYATKEEVAEVLKYFNVLGGTCEYNYAFGVVDKVLIIGSSVYEKEDVNEYYDVVIKPLKAFDSDYTSFDYYSRKTKISDGK